MEEGKENITYSAEYIRKYLEGQLSDREMQALEKAALEDPFLADAIEGLEESRRQSVSFESNISDLQKRLSDRIRQRDRKKGIVYLLSNWQVAASVLFVIGTVVFTYTFINNKNSQTNIAKTIKKDSGIEKQNPGVQDALLDSTAVARKNSPTSGAPADSNVVAFTEPPAIEKKSRLKKSYETVSAENNDKISKSRAISTLPGSAAAKKDLSVVTNDTPVLRMPPVPAASALQGKVAGVYISKDKASPNYIQGLVLNDSNQPIPFATVNLSGTKKAVSADEKGYFKMYLDKADAPREIVINSTGFQPVSTEFNPDSALVQKFQMQASASLSEVVVTGYGTEDSKDLNLSSPKKQTNQTALPAGWDSLYHYINSNKKITTTDSLLKGEEVISFTVNKNGELSSFNVVKSISPVHDAEIIRLIKSGPPLKPQKGKKQVCQIAVLF